MDPCDLRLAKGDAAVRELVATRTRLFEFVIRAELAKHNLDTPEGRVHALRGTAPIVAKIRDSALRNDYTRRLAGWLGLEERDVQPVVRRLVATSGNRADQVVIPAGDGNGSGNRGGRGGRGDWNDRQGRQGSNNRRGAQGGGYGGQGGGYGGQGGQGGYGGRGGGRGGYNAPSGQGGLFGAEAATVPNPRDPVAGAEREALKMALQYPQLAGADLRRPGARRVHDSGICGDLRGRARRRRLPHRP